MINRDDQTYKKYCGCDHCILSDIRKNNLDFILNQLRDSCLFSSLDIKSAFQSLELDPQSARLTTFSTIYGSYFFKVLATGLASSPNSLSQFCDKIRPQFFQDVVLFCWLHLKVVTVRIKSYLRSSFQIFVSFYYCLAQ